MTSKKSTSTRKQSAPAPTFTRVVVPQEQMDEIRREILKSISSERVEDHPKTIKDAENDDAVGNSFAWSASQVNTDLGVAAHCEMQDDFFLFCSDEWFDFCRSPMFWELQSTFLRNAIDGESDPFLYAILRAYHAGRACPDRLYEDSQEVRRARHIKRHEQERESRRRQQEREAQETKAA